MLNVLVFYFVVSVSVLSARTLSLCEQTGNNIGEPSLAMGISYNEGLPEAWTGYFDISYEYYVANPLDIEFLNLRAYSNADNLFYFKSLSYKPNITNLISNGINIDFAIGTNSIKGPITGTFLPRGLLIANQYYLNPISNMKTGVFFITSTGVAKVVSRKYFYENLMEKAPFPKDKSKKVKFLSVKSAIEGQALLDKGKLCLDLDLDSPLSTDIDVFTVVAVCQNNKVIFLRNAEKTNLFELAKFLQFEGVKGAILLNRGLENTGIFYNTRVYGENYIGASIISVKN